MESAIEGWISWQRQTPPWWWRAQGMSTCAPL